MSLNLRLGHCGVVPVVVLLLGSANAAAQTPQPATGRVFGIAAAAPADRIQLSADQVRAILTAHHPGVVAGTSEDNILTIVVASNGDYVASGTSQGAVAGAIRPASATSASGIAGGASPVAAGGFSSATGGSVAPAAAVAVPRGDDGQPHFIKLAGIGDVDASLVKDMYMTRFAAGEVSVNGLVVRIVTLKGTAMK